MYIDLRYHLILDLIRKGEKFLEIHSSNEQLTDGFNEAEHTEKLN